jgi:beta-glucanase (GH16 family)
MDSTWHPKPVKTNWALGSIFAKEQYRTHYGIYRFTFTLPHFQGAWPAIWFVDFHNKPPKGDGMGMPPEIDVMEYFRKDGYNSRRHLTCTFHHGDTYEENIYKQATYQQLFPIDNGEINLYFVWTPKSMQWIVNNKLIMTVDSSTRNYPKLPMNLIINNGIGLDWKPVLDNPDQFTVIKAEYYPLSVVNNK